MKMNLKNLAELRVEMSRYVVQLRMTKQKNGMKFDAWKDVSIFLLSDA